LNVTLTMDPAFEAAMVRAIEALDSLLGHRDDVRSKLQVLLDASQGTQPNRFGGRDPDALRGEQSSNADLASHPEDDYGTTTTPATSQLRVGALDTLFETWPDGGWQSIGGVITGPPAAVALAPGLLDTFVRGTDQAIWYQSYRLQQWGGWARVSSNAYSIAAAISVAVDPANNPIVHLFARNGDPANANSVVHAFATAADVPGTPAPSGSTPTPATQPLVIGTWSEESVALGALNSDPVAVSCQLGRADVFVCGTDGSIYTATTFNATTNTDANLGAFTQIPPSQNLKLVGTPSVVSSGTGILDVFARSADGQLHHFQCNVATPKPTWTHELLSDSSHKLVGDPVAISWGAQTTATSGPGRIDVFAATAPDSLLQFTFSGGPNTKGGVSAAWAAPMPAGNLMNAGAGGTAPSTIPTIHVASWGPGRIDLFIRGADQVLWHKWLDAGIWYGWEPLGDQLQTEPTAVAWTQGAIELFVGRVDASVWHRNRLPDSEWATVGTSGLQGLVTTLNGLVNTVNDAIDLGFAKTQAAIYRVRQQVLTSTAASRLATSPALADIASGESAAATAVNIANYVAAAKTATVPQPQNSPAVPTFLASELLRRSAAVAGNVPSILKGINQSTNARTFVGPTVLGGTSIATTVQTPSFTSAGAAIRNLGVAVATPPPVAQVVGQTPIVGAVPIQRNLAIAERLAIPAALESWQFALAVKYSVLVALANLDIDVSGIEVPGLGVPRRDSNGNPVLDQWGQAIVDRPLIDLVTLREQAQAAALLSEPQPHDTDESSYFAQTVEFIEHAVIGLRGIEGRVTEYQALAQLVQSTRDSVNASVAQGDARLKALGDQITNARQAVLVARSFYAEERTKVTETVRRRLRVLALYVPYYVFVRPRVADLFEPAPVQSLTTDVADEAVPAALASNEAAPPELMALIELLREAPLGWLTQVPPIFLGIDRLDSFTRTVYSAQARAASRPLYALPPMPTGILADGITHAFSAQGDVIVAARQATAAMDPSIFAALSWRNAQTQAAMLISVGDLVDAPHGRLDVSRNAAEVIENIQKVATALYLDFGKVDPELRLAWAQKYAQYDQGVDFHELTNLINWTDVPILDRQTMQALVTWIFQQFNADESRAVALANDVVRVALLLASHEPVSQALAGYVPKPTTVAVGGIVDVQVDPTRVRIGMQAILGASGLVGDGTASISPTAHAVVEDISAGVARVRILSASTSSIQFAASTPIKLVDPARGASLFRDL
jgi:hypothetical protein